MEAAVRGGSKSVGEYEHQEGRPPRPKKEAQVWGEENQRAAGIVI